MNPRRLVAWATLVVAVAGSAVAGWAYFRTSSPSYRRLDGTLVAAVTFDAPTDAWVSTSGTRVLYQRGGQWTLGTFGVDGSTSLATVDEVSVLDDHVVYELAGPPAALVIDESEYTLVDGAYVSGDCYWCSHPFPDQPVVADVHDGRWKITVGATISFVRQPAGWDGRPTEAVLDPSGSVVIVARLNDSSTALVDHSVCAVDGSWALVSASAQGVLLHRVDTARLDYSVVRFPRCV